MFYYQYQLTCIQSLLQNVIKDPFLLGSLLNQSGFEREVLNKINAYYKIDDKVRAYQSAIFKYHYLPDFYQWSRKEIKIGEDNYHRPYFLLSPFKIDFNISHSGDWVVLAHKKGNNKIGIDIEYIDKAIDFATLKPITFSKIEQSYIVCPFTFFTLWAKKEALIKTVGKGFLDDMYLHTELDASHQQWYSYQKKMYYLEYIKVADNYICFICEEKDGTK